MSTLGTYVISKTSARKILGLSYFEIDHLVEGKTDVVVHLKNGRTIEIKKTAFMDIFYSSRMLRSKDISLSFYKNGIVTCKGSNGEIYKLSLNPIHCTCKDFQIQEEMHFSIKRCKHIFALLREVQQCKISV